MARLFRSSPLSKYSATSPADSPMICWPCKNLIPYVIRKHEMMPFDTWNYSNHNVGDVSISMACFEKNAVNISEYIHLWVCGEGKGYLHLLVSCWTCFVQFVWSSSSLSLPWSPCGGVSNNMETRSAMPTGQWPSWSGKTYSSLASSKAASSLSMSIICLLNS